MCQQQAFKEEVETRMYSGNGDRKTSMKRGSVYKLDPFIDERVTESCITRLIVEWCHQKIHGGRGLPINEIMSNGFWVVSCSTIVRRLVGNCCTKFVA